MRFGRGGLDLADATVRRGLGVPVRRGHRLGVASLAGQSAR